jgi:hypothetical protein
LGERCLSEALAQSDAAGVEAGLDGVLESLHAIHEAGRESGLESQIAAIGHKAGWLDELTTMPARLGAHRDMPPVAIEAAAPLAHLRVSTPRFIK